MIARRPPDPGPEEEPSFARHEEELVAGTALREAGTVGVRKVVERHHVETVAPRGVEHAEVERQGPVEGGDSGEVEILPDGSVSIPVFEEELVIERRLVVRERVIVRKHTVTEERQVEADLRRERVEVDADPEVADRVTPGHGVGWGDQG